MLNDEFSLSLCDNRSCSSYCLKMSCRPRTHRSVFFVLTTLLTHFKLRAIVEFVNHQTVYLTAAAESAKALQAQVADLAGELGQGSGSTQFPRRNSNSNNVPVNDILKVSHLKITQYA